MTLWKNLVVALVAAFVLAACSSSDDNGGSTSDETPPAQSGPTQAQLDAEKARADAAEEAISDKEAAEAAEQLTKTAAALKAALGANPLGNLVEIDAANPLPATPSLTLAGLILGDQGPLPANSDDVRTPLMAPGASAGSLSDWAGRNYAHTNAIGGTNTALVYRNPAASDMKPFAEGATFGDDEAAFETAYSGATRTLNLSPDPDASLSIKSSGFPAAGTTTYTTDVVTGSVVIPGTYQGASGNYRCTPAGGTACTAAASTGGVDLGGQWYFIHDVGAMVTLADAAYLYFGWWLQKDEDGVPTSASAFTGTIENVDLPAVNPNTLVGSATYTGHAAGKFAVSDPLGDDNAGHFTADASLKAVFGANTAGGGLSGTLDNFMANDQAVPWSVSLLRRGWDDTTNGLADEPMNDPVTDPDVNEGVTSTIWSIDGNAAAASGRWSAQMYDEAPGTVAAGGDGSDVPTSVTGTFQSDFGAIGTMVGAFGATRDE